jgi:hypothetical protein
MPASIWTTASRQRCGDSGGQRLPSHDRKEPVGIRTPAGKTVPSLCPRVSIRTYQERPRPTSWSTPISRWLSTSVGSRQSWSMGAGRALSVVSASVIPSQPCDAVTPSKRRSAVLPQAGTDGSSALRGQDRTHLRLLRRRPDHNLRHLHGDIRARREPRATPEVSSGTRCARDVTMAWLRCSPPFPNPTVTSDLGL